MLKLPCVIRIEPSSLCNLNCIHCPTGTIKDTNRGIMSPETFKLVLKEVDNLKPDTAILYHGGEPFINKNTSSMIKQLKFSGIPFIKTVTNGMLLTHQMLIDIIQSGLDCIEFSLDGKSPTENNEIRKGCDYNKIASTIKELIRLKQKLNSKTPEIVIVNCQFSTNNKPLEVPNYLLYDFASFKYSLSIRSFYAIYWCNSSSLHGYSGKTNNYCKNPMEFITIRWNGDIVACCYDITNTYVLGNIKESPIASIWENDKYKALRDSISSKQYLPLCQNCWIVKPDRLLCRKEIGE